jgi:predicted transcriptional regulator
MYLLRGRAVKPDPIEAPEVFDPTLLGGQDERSDRPEASLQQTIRVPNEVGDQLRLLATLTGTDEEEHLRRAVRVYLETSGRESEVAAFTGRAREGLRAALDRLGDL